VTVTTAGKIYLVGAGPGDPDLLTVKALRLIQTADAVVYDRLVSHEIRQLIPDTVERVYVGKASGQHTLSQSQINALLVELAGKRQHVVRLKGGDPYIFGRGGEEALVLARHGIAFEVVPGITAAQACAAYAGIPLTHRGLAHGVQFLTGQRMENATLDMDRASLCDPNQTLVVYMGVGHVDEIVQGLVAAGRAQNTPAAIVERGTTACQRSIVTTLGELPTAVRRNGIEPPALLIIGTVVALAGELDWFTPWLQEAELKYA
jgi:uroporphyrin-III C-methyltransferase/precorrin-2 dehydrogenase/sirohydrochlorin ferrochelatase/uroporphyrin-III C-methyltransferase